MVKESVYIPDAGDVVILDFTSRSDSDDPKRGRRLSLVISPKAYNEKTGLALFCPITPQIKGYPFEVILKNTKTSGAVLCDQIKSLDWNSRKIFYVEKIPVTLFNPIVQCISALISSK